MRPFAATLACALLSASVVWPTPAAAGEEFTSVNSRAGVFITFPSGGAIGFDTPEKANALASHCNRGGAIFRDQGGRYRCKVVLGSGADAGFGRIDILGSGQDVYDDPFALFTIAPVRPTKWTTRAVQG